MENINLEVDLLKNNLYRRRLKRLLKQKLEKSGYWKVKLHKEIQPKPVRLWFTQVFIIFSIQDILPTEMIWIILGFFYKTGIHFPFLRKREITF